MSRVGNGVDKAKREAHTVSCRTATPCLKKLCQHILLLICQIQIDFNKNWKDCPGINPQQNCTQIAHFT